MRAEAHEEQAGEPQDDEDHGEGTLPPQGLLGNVLLAVDAQEHDHEQEQHDDGAGVHDDLDGRQEVGLLLDEEHGHAEQRHHEHQGGVDGVAGHHDADGAGEHDGRGDGEGQGVDGGGGEQRGHHQAPLSDEVPSVGVLPGAVSRPAVSPLFDEVF